MKTVIVVSKCLKVDQTTKTATFHFKGVAAGKTIKKVVMTYAGPFSPKKGTEYLMYCRMNDIQNGVLIGEILKAKELDECWDQAAEVRV